jgi:hypothetical protein
MVAIEGDHRINLGQGRKPYPNISRPFLRTIHAAEAHMLPHRPTSSPPPLGAPASTTSPSNSHSERYPAVPVMCRERDCAGTLATASASTTGIHFESVFIRPASTEPQSIASNSAASELDVTYILIERPASSAAPSLQMTDVPRARCSRSVI